MVSFLVFFCDGFIFVKCLMVSGYSRLEKEESNTNSEPQYLGVNFELNLLTHIPGEMQFGKATVIFVGDVEQK